MNERELRLEPGKTVKEQLLSLPESDIEQLAKQATEWADYGKYTTLMNNIAREMKEIPELPSETRNPGDTNALKKVEFPEDGGVLTWMEGFDYPFRGYPHFEFVDKIDFIKKVNRAFISGLYHQLKSYSKWRFITLLPSLWLTKDILRSWVYIFYRHIDRFKVKTLRYSEPIREVYRAFSISIQGESYRDKCLREQLRDLLCMILEFDNAYRFRFQDIVIEVNKDNLQKHPRKEITRLLEIMSSREKLQEIKDTWKLLRYIVLFYLAFDKGLSKIISQALFNLDLEKVKLNTNDKMFCIPRVDYVFGFVLNPLIEDKKLIGVSNLNKEYKNKVKEIRDMSTKEHFDSKDVEKMKELDTKYSSLLKEAEEDYVIKKNKLMNVESI